MASSTSGGVLADDDMSEGKDWEREKSGSKFRNSVQSELNEGSAGCNESSCGISNRALSASIDTAMSAGGALGFNFSTSCVRQARSDSLGTEAPMHGRGLKKSRSNEVKSGGVVETGLGIWKVWSKSGHVGAVDTERGSEVTCNRPPSILPGCLGRG